MKKPALSADALTYFREQGARGGKRAAANMTPAERKARAMKGGNARAKKKQVKG